MKKVFLMLVAGAFISMSMMSCKKTCGYCDYGSGQANGAELCEKDGKAAYDAYKSACTAAQGTFVED